MYGKFASKEAKKTIQSIKKACVEVGFFQVIGHGLQNEEIKNICAVGNKFFNMEDKYKRKLSPKKWNKQNKNIYRGYFPNDVNGKEGLDLVDLTVSSKYSNNIKNQYIEYLNQLIHGNLGISLNTQEPVKVIISKALPASLELAIFSILIASLVGYLIGFLGAVKPESKIDFSGRIFGIGTYALPPFWAAMLIQIIFAVFLGWLPIGGRLPPGAIPPPPITGFLLLDSIFCLLYTSPSPRDLSTSRMPSSA